MAARRPTRIEYNDHVLKVKWLQDLGRFPQGYAMAGDHETGLIRMSAGQTPRGERVTMLHEIMHEAFRVSHTKVKKADEEYILANIDGWLFDILDQNPELRSYLWD